MGIFSGGYIAVAICGYVLNFAWLSMAMFVAICLLQFRVRGIAKHELWNETFVISMENEGRARHAACCLPARRPGGAGSNEIHQKLIEHVKCMKYIQHDYNSSETQIN